MVCNVLLVRAGRGRARLETAHFQRHFARDRLQYGRGVFLRRVPHVVSVYRQNLIPFHQTSVDAGRAARNLRTERRDRFEILITVRRNRNRRNGCSGNMNTFGSHRRREERWRKMITTLNPFLGLFCLFKFFFFVFIIGIFETIRLFTQKAHTKYTLFRVDVGVYQSS